MSSSAKRFIICTLGILGGLAAWPAAEVILLYQASFPSYLIFSLIQGSALGLFLGIFFGSAEGIISSDKTRGIKGIMTGAFVGLAGGAIGMLIGQAVLFLLRSTLFTSFRSFNFVGLHLARALGWAAMGVFIGMIEGIRALSGRKISVGILGGFSGGLLGGVVYEYLSFLFPSAFFARLAGLTVLGLLIALFYALIEKRLSPGVLRLLNGSLKGKEFFINQRRLRIGSSVKNDICLKNYEGVAERHAVIRFKRDDVHIEESKGENPVFVNDQKVKSRTLKYEDVLRIGSAKFFFKT